MVILFINKGAPHFLELLDELLLPVQAEVEGLLDFRPGHPKFSSYLLRDFHSEGIRIIFSMDDRVQNG